MPERILVVTRSLRQEVESRITRDYVARFNVQDRLYSSDELIDVSAGADALLITQQDVMNAVGPSSFLPCHTAVGGHG